MLNKLSLILSNCRGCSVKELSEEEAQQLERELSEEEKQKQADEDEKKLVFVCHVIM